MGWNVSELAGCRVDDGKLDKALPIYNDVLARAKDHPLAVLGRALANPVSAAIAMGLVMFAWHIPSPYELALRSEFWHEVEHASFFLASLMFWWPVILPWPSRGQWPRWAMVPYLLVADLQNTALSAVLTFADRVLYRSYSEAPRLFGVSALEDQVAAGAFMWVAGSLVIPTRAYVW